MAGWDDVIKEISDAKDPASRIRQKYLGELSEFTGRNTIAYYSAWLSCHAGNLDINDLDMSGLMNAIKGMDKEIDMLYDFLKIKENSENTDTRKTEMSSERTIDYFEKRWDSSFFATSTRY